MITESIEERAYAIITPIVEGLGCEVVEIEYKLIGKNYHLTVYIYKEDGITLNDCEVVSKAIDAPLDEADLTAGKNFILDVSSPGLDRKIVTDDDFRRNLGVEVEALLINAIERKKKVVGILASYSDTEFVLDVKDTMFTLMRDNVKILKPFIRF